MKIFSYVNGRIDHCALVDHCQHVVSLESPGKSLSSLPFRIAEYNNGFVVVSKTVVTEAHHIKAVLAKICTHFCRGTRFPATVQDFHITLVASLFLNDDFLLLAPRKHNRGNCKKSKNKRADFFFENVVNDKKHASKIEKISGIGADYLQ